MGESTMGNKPVEIIHVTRNMKSYTITESELLQLSFINTRVTFSWSIVTGIGMFLIDIVKDAILAEKIPNKAISIGIYVGPILLFVLIAASIHVYKDRQFRKRLVDLIKDESPS
jgi:hypothetical protein